MPFGCLLGVFWMSLGCLWDDFGMSFGCLLDAFWMSFACLWISVRLTVDGHNKYPELGSKTDCG